MNVWWLRSLTGSWFRKYYNDFISISALKSLVLCQLNILQPSSLVKKTCWFISCLYQQLENHAISTNFIACICRKRTKLVNGKFWDGNFPSVMINYYYVFVGWLLCPWWMLGWGIFSLVLFLEEREFNLLIKLYSLYICHKYNSII